jgi:hypothetical protein
MPRAFTRKATLSAATASLVIACSTSPSPSSSPPSSSSSAPSDAGQASGANPATGVESDATGTHLVVVRADRGPHAASKPVQVDRRLYGMNIADWRPQDYVPVAAPGFVTWLGALRPGVLRWPAGHTSQEYVWTRGGGPQSGSWTLTPEHLDAFIALSHEVGAEPLIGINVKRGNPGAAADLVRYLDVDHHDDVHWFFIGNEPDFGDGLTPDPNTYADELITFTDAMRAVDPSIGIVGPELLTGAHVGGIQGNVDWMTPVLARAGDRIAAISWHSYPLDSGQVLSASSATLSIPHLFQETAADWPEAGMSFVDQIMPALAATRDAHAPGASIWITEMAEDPGPAAGAGVSDTQAAALWVGDALGRYAEYGPGAVVRFLFKGDRLGYALLDGNDHPRATYGAYWLYARYFGDRFVESSSDALATVAVHAALRGDGALTVALVNKTTTAQHVRLDVSGFSAQTASQLTLAGAGGELSSVSFTIEGEALTSANVATGIQAAALDSTHLFDTVVPAASMRLLVYR